MWKGLEKTEKRERERDREREREIRKEQEFREMRIARMREDKISCTKRLGARKHNCESEEEEERERKREHKREA